MSKSFWRCLEEFPGGFAGPGIWRERLGEAFGSVQTAFLEPGSAHPVATNKADPPDLKPSAAARDGLRINKRKLCKAISAALGLDHKTIDLPLPDTWQIGSWSSDVVPVILTVQTESQTFRHVICELALRLRKPFILLGPTSSHLDVACHELLAHAKAEFFGLDSHTSITPSGSLRALKSPRELFAQFTPAPSQPLDEDTTRKAFALVKALDNEKFMKKPSAAAVFSFYCIDGLNVTEIARRCHCSRGTILNRLNFIRKKTGTNLESLRQLSTFLSSDKESISDSRARHIHRKNLIRDPEDDEE